MDFSVVQPYVGPGLVVGFLGWKFLKFRKVKKQIPELIAQGALVVDVRSPGEYKSGAAKGSLNIPLDELEKKINQLNPEKTIVLCCASGTRSGMAVRILKRHGFKDILNAGPWRNVVVK